MEFHPSEHQHQRWNPLRGEWILVSPHRLQRPWSGAQEETALPVPDPDNPLCPGVTRPNGIRTPDYESTYVFTNDFPALNTDAPEPPLSKDPLFQMAPARGTCKVICYSPKTDTTMGIMTIQEIIKIIEVWIDELLSLGKTYEWVQIFENRGEIMGCSNPHPHGQIWASNFIPNEPRTKDIKQREYYEKHGTPMLLDYVKKEMESQERIVLSNKEWVVVVPFWASWPYETMVLPRTHIRRMSDMNHDQKVALAYILRQLLTKYDNLFRTIFPFSMGWHGAPTGSKLGENMDHWVFHGIYYPPLLRSATIKKFMVGYELLCQTQRDVTPETAAATLRGISEIDHFFFKDVKDQLVAKAKK
uniref:Galactose-1-phosphate uridylyltransferase n=1 Tax=Lygus hesperus TaxID=30085 RepID=A0A0A9X1B0_LYGHE